MKKRIFAGIVILLSFAGKINAQMPTCPSPYVFMDGGNFIRVYDPSVPLSATNPSNTNIPTCPGGSGLALMPNINGGTLSPTFYSTAGGNYWYWNGGAWQNTGNGTGNGAAVNIGGCGSFMYNLVGASGQIWVYSGAGTGTLLTTIAGFAGGGPYDVCTDCNCNFYILKTTNPQSLTMYNPAGVATCSYALVNMPIATAGGGFAMIGNQIYVKNNLANGFFIGTLAGPSITFTQFPGFNGNPGDFASCPTCEPLPVIASNSGTLGCGASTVNIFATTTVAPVTYSWSGPGILGPGNASVDVVNLPGVYTCTVSAGGCPPTQSIVSTTVVSNGYIINAAITPTGNICLTGLTQLMVTPDTPTNNILWTGPGIVSGANSATVTINSAGLYSVSITNTLNTCAGSASVLVHPTPTLGINYSSNTVCAQNINNSPNSITLTPSGANTYTLLMSNNYTSPSPNGPVMPITPIAPFSASITVGSNTLIGVIGVCSATTTSTFSIHPNPMVSVVPTASTCFGDSYTYVASGASTYTWSPGTGLNTIYGPTVVASPTVTSAYSLIGTSLGCKGPTQTTTLLIVPNPTVVISPPHPTVCAGSTVNLTASGATTYSWTPPIGLDNTFGPTTGASPGTNQTYSILGTQNTCTHVGVVTVSVIPLPNLVVNVAKTGICLGDNTQIMANGAAGFSWTPNWNLSSPYGPAVTAAPVNSTTYTVVGNIGACYQTRTVSIDVIPRPNMNVSSPNFQICEGGSTFISATGAQTYSWWPKSGLTFAGEGNVIASPSVSTNYTIAGSNTSGSVSCTHVIMYSVSVIPYAKAILPATASLCLGESRAIGVSGGNTYSWSPSTGLNTIFGHTVMASPRSTTIYTVNSSFNGNCSTNGTIQVNVLPVPFVDAGEDARYNADDQDKVIKAIGSGTITWIDGDGIWCKVCPETPVYTTLGGCYVVEAVNDFGCAVRDEVCIDILHEFGIYIPDTFTPNGDGVNDIFYVHGFSITDVNMTIFDRWGEKIFTSKEQSVGWPGTYKGQPVPIGVYVYKVDYKGVDGKAYVKTGHVTVHR